MILFLVCCGLMFMVGFFSVYFGWGCCICWRRFVVRVLW